jgi:hypothetical protein
MITLTKHAESVTSLKESLLGNTKSKVGKMSETVKKAQLEQLGFPDYEDEFDGWVWQCPDILERNESNIYKITKRKKTYCGFWVEMISGSFPNYTDTKDLVYVVSIDAITDHRGETPWMGSQTLISFVVPYDKHVVYEFFEIFALNVDEMIKDFIKLGDDYDIKELYPMLMKKYGK